ncbi:hypothetical protein MKZ17_11010 [Solibacillus sp. FSL R7-0682]|uniref:hypothetical protein n=1 Tax=Solibacillus sp. FSL R7-0682 TaxID=2921690 RepID=UPI0030F56E4D
MSVIYKNAEKKDKGFVIVYHKLSYRRRFIRTLWLIPFVSLLYLTMYWIGDLTSNENITIGVILLFLLLLDILYNFTKWKNSEKQV